MRRRLPLQAALALLGIGIAPVLWAAPPLSEAAVKAAFVYNFAKFVEWPSESFAHPLSPIRFCLYGSRDPFLAALAEIDGKAAQSRPIRVQKVTQAADFPNCHILVLAESERRQLAETLQAIQDAGILTVAEWEGFADAGGIIGLVVDNERVQFEVNLEAARRQNIKLSSQLLKLARKIRRQPPQKPPGLPAPAAGSSGSPGPGHSPEP